MESENITDEEVYRFILLQMESVPHLEALLLLWRKCPKPFTDQALASQLSYVGTVRNITEDLQRAGLIGVSTSVPLQYFYEPTFERSEALMEAVASLYHRELVDISRLSTRKRNRLHGISPVLSSSQRIGTDKEAIV